MPRDQGESEERNVVTEGHRRTKFQKEDISNTAEPRTEKYAFNMLPENPDT